MELRGLDLVGAKMVINASSIFCKSLVLFILFRIIT